MSSQPGQLRAELSALIDNKNFAALKARLAPWLPADLAPIISELPVEQLGLLFRHATPSLAAATFAYLGHAAKHKLLKTLTQPQAAALLNELPPDDRTAFLKALAAFAAREPAVLETFAEGSDALGFDLWALAQSGPQEAQNLTENTQPLILTASVAIWRTWRMFATETG